MMKKIFMLAMALLCIACITGCRKKKVTIESITVIESTVPSSILNTEVESKLTTIKFNVNKSDDSKEEKNLEKFHMWATKDFYGGLFCFVWINNKRYIKGRNIIPAFYVSIKDKIYIPVFKLVINN